MLVSRAKKDVTIVANRDFYVIESEKRKFDELGYVLQFEASASDISQQYVMVTPQEPIPEIKHEHYVLKEWHYTVHDSTELGNPVAANHLSCLFAPKESIASKAKNKRFNYLKIRIYTCPQESQGVAIAEKFTATADMTDIVKKPGNKQPIERANIANIISVASEHVVRIESKLGEILLDYEQQAEQITKTIEKQTKDILLSNQAGHLDEFDQALEKLSTMQSFLLQDYYDI